MSDTEAERSPRLLLTGFEGFGEHPVNSSWELARSFEGQTLEMVNIVTAQLPVNWETAWPALQAAIEQTDPTWVLMLGVAGNRTAVTPESRARNHTAPRLDNAGADPPLNNVVVPEGPEYRNTTIPALLLVERFGERGVPTEVSTDAGDFLCNWTLYHALAYAEGRRSLRGVGFVHVPPLSPPAEAGLPFAAVREGLRFAIDSLVAGAAPLFDVMEAQLEAERHRHG
jgi:pyroglutamyl-peptidase